MDEPDAQEKTIWVADLRVGSYCESCHIVSGAFLLIPITVGGGEGYMPVNSYRKIEFITKPDLVLNTVTILDHLLS